MNYINIVKQSIDFIEENLKETLSLEELANRFFTTKYHYSRIFKAVTGISVIDYYRKRKLSDATFELQNSQKNILEIALDYGYNSHEAFSRTYKKYMNTNPSSIRKGKKNINIFPKFTIIERNFKNYQNTILIDHKICTRNEMELWGIKERIKFEPEIVKTETIKSVEFFLSKSNHLRNYYFISFSKSFPNKQLNYGVYVNKEEKLNIEINLEKLILPKSKYLEIEYNGKMEENWKNVLDDINMIVKTKKLQSDKSIISFFQAYSTKSIPVLQYKIYVPLK